MLLAITQENGNVEAAEIDDTLKHCLSTCNDRIPARTEASVTSSAASKVAKSTPRVVPKMRLQPYGT